MIELSIVISYLIYAIITLVCMVIGAIGFGILTAVFDDWKSLITGPLAVICTILAHLSGIVTVILIIVSIVVWVIA